ncbi:MAG TPA: AraC family transcriptional regulator [Chitinophagaceae bacterium]|nr:AraC family transcriptional regulator [Chitinophagaceae bacterium]
MKAALHKSAIPQNSIFVVRHLKEKFFDPEWHAHSEYQLFVVVKGTGTRFIGDSIKAFGPGELIMTGPHLPHLWRSDDAYFDKGSRLFTEGIVIYFNEGFLGEHFLDKEETTMIRKLFTRSKQGLEFSGREKNMVIHMMKEVITLKGVQRVIQLLRILEMLAHAKTYHYLSSKAYENEFNQNETDRLNIVYEYVMRHFRQKIQLEELAKLLHMTPTSFSRYFSRKNNMPFSKFVSELRIRHACKLLTETELPVEQICYECGFNTVSNFNRQFLELMQKKPTQYKKEFMSI